MWHHVCTILSKIRANEHTFLLIKYGAKSVRVKAKAPQNIELCDTKTAEKKFKFSVTFRRQITP